jgi:hypothetical protein
MEVPVGITDSFQICHGSTPYGYVGHGRFVMSLDLLSNYVNPCELDLSYSELITKKLER